MKIFSILFAIIVLCFLFVSCENDQVNNPESPAPNNQNTFLAKVTGNPSDIDLEHIAALVAEVNAVFEAGGSKYRLTQGWFFTLGYGTDPYMRLRTGSRWIPSTITYVLDQSDYTTDVSFSECETALVKAYETYNNITNTNITAQRVPDNGDNFDFLDGTYDAAGNCIALYDFSSTIFDPATGNLYPYADVCVGGWVNPNYFSQALGSANIIGVTWTFSDVDSDGDQYSDILYVEQFYNPTFAWTTTEAVYLDFDAPMDIETIAVHENGHTFGLGHMGGPVKNQPFKLQPNFKVFNPEAIMNPYYLGGEKRDLYPTDIAAMRTMYTGH